MNNDYLSRLRDMMQEVEERYGRNRPIEAPPAENDSYTVDRFTFDAAAESRRTRRMRENMRRYITIGGIEYPVEEQLPPRARARPDLRWDHIAPPLGARSEIFAAAPRWEIHTDSCKPSKPVVQEEICPLCGKIRSECIGE